MTQCHACVTCIWNFISAFELCHNVHFQVVAHIHDFIVSIDKHMSLHGAWTSIDVTLYYSDDFKHAEGSLGAGLL